MFKLLIILLATCALYTVGNASGTGLDLVVPDGLASGRSFQQTSAMAIEQSRPHGISAVRNTISDEVGSAEEGRLGASSPYQSFSTLSASSSSGGGGLAGSSSASSISSSSSGSIRSPSLVISTAASSRNLPAIQHQILPAQTIPLPITISTRPGLRTVIAPETITIQQPTVARIGEVVQNIPTAVSHQRQTVVHNHARVVTPIVAPAVRTITSQQLRAYHTPLVYAPQTSILQGKH